MSRFELILLCLCMGACSAPEPPPPPADPLGMVGLHGTGFHLVDDPAQFIDRVVGQSLDGPGYHVTIQSGGHLSGLYAGRRFNGSWSFANGQYCHSFEPTLSGPSYSCHWVAVKGNDVRLIPVPATA